MSKQSSSRDRVLNAQMHGFDSGDSTAPLRVRPVDRTAPPPKQGFSNFDDAPPRHTTLNKNGPPPGPSAASIPSGQNPTTNPFDENYVEPNPQVKTPSTNPFDPDYVDPNFANFDSPEAKAAFNRPPPPDTRLEKAFMAAEHKDDFFIDELKNAREEAEKGNKQPEIEMREFFKNNRTTPGFEAAYKAAVDVIKTEQLSARQDKEAKEQASRTPMDTSSPAFKDRIQGMNKDGAAHKESTRFEKMKSGIKNIANSTVGKPLVHAFDLATSPLQLIRAGGNATRAMFEKDPDKKAAYQKQAIASGKRFISGIKTAVSPALLAVAAIGSAVTRVPGIRSIPGASTLKDFSDKQVIDNAQRTMAVAGLTAVALTGGGALAPVATAGVVAAATTAASSLLVSSGVAGFASAALATATALPSAALATATALPNMALTAAITTANASLGAAVAVGVGATVVAGAVATGVVVAGVKSVNYAKTKATNLLTSVKQAISSPAKEVPITERTPLLGKGVENSSAVEPPQKTSTMQKMFSKQKTSSKPPPNAKAPSANKGQRI